LPPQLNGEQNHAPGIPEKRRSSPAHHRRCAAAGVASARSLRLKVKPQNILLVGASGTSRLARRAEATSRSRVTAAARHQSSPVERKP
jgi:hypothetical protein